MPRPLLGLRTKNAIALVILAATACLIAATSLRSMPWSDSPFLGTRWTLVQIGNDTTVNSQAPSVTFGPEGASGFDGCTTFVVGGKVDPRNIRLDTTRMALAPVACPPQFLLPGTFRTALLHAARATVEGDRMTLVASDGRVLARFRATR